MSTYILVIWMDPPFRKTYCIAFMIFLVSTMASVGMPSEGVPSNGGSHLAREEYKGDVWPLSGTGDIYDISRGFFYGDTMEGTGGRLGEYIWIGDLDGDPIPDLAMAAPHVDGADGKSDAGSVYIFKDPGPVNGTWDLTVDEPDLVIRGGHVDSKMLTSMDIGDIDNDGNRDILLGIPSQPEAGRAYILWGDGAWSGEVDLYDPGRLEPNGDPYGFLRTQDHLIMAGHIAPVPYPESDYKVGRSVLCRDLDSDGHDEAIITVPGSNMVCILWGGPNRLTVGDEMTMIVDTEATGLFGDEVIPADLNGNGDIDLLVTAPIRDNPDMMQNQVGYVMVIFDAGRVRGNVTLSVDDVVRPFIRGNDHYDQFGKTVRIADINEDGKDDMIIGCPNGDGLNDNRPYVGSIHVIYGAQSNQFPLDMDSESGANMVIHGRDRELPTYPGDKIGTMFDVGDVNGDGKEDLIIGLPDRKGSTGYEKAGAVEGYLFGSVFGSGKSAIELANIEIRFSIEGHDMQDRLGQMVRTADLDLDGAADLVLATASADGPDNSRPGCGEVYTVPGSMVTLDALTLTGTGMSHGKVLAGKAPVTMSLNFTATGGISYLAEMVIEMPSAGTELRFGLSDDGGSMVTAPYGCVKDVSNLSLTRSGASDRWSASFDMLVDWTFPGGVHDIIVRLEGSLISYYRTYDNVLESVNSVTLYGDPVLEREGIPLPHRGIWLAMGDIINISGIGISYDNDPPVPLVSGPFHLMLEVDDVQKKIDSFTLDESVTLSSSGTVGIEIGPVLDHDRLPDGLPSKNTPRVLGEIAFDLRIDDTAPDPPSGLVIGSGPQGGPYDPDGTVDLRWDLFNGTSDGDGSGVWGYEYRYGAVSGLVRSPGGWRATFYNDDIFWEPALDRLEDRMEFNWGKFPPYPEIVPEGYSIRWYGWLKAPEHGSTRFTIWGSGGEAFVTFDGEVLFGWSNLDISKTSDYLELEEGSLHYVEMYMRQTGNTGSRLELKWDDESGDPVTIGPEYLYHTTNRTTLDTGADGEYEIEVRSIDWVGSVSGPSVAGGIVDKVGPTFDLSGMANWYNSTSIEMRYKVRDPEIGSGPGSGVDPTSIAYRLREGSAVEYYDWTSGGTWTSVEGDGTLSVLTRFELPLHWRGFVQFSSADMVGNQEITSAIPLGVDVNPPVFDLLAPSTTVTHLGRNVDLAVMVKDIKGSGVDGNSFRFRHKGNDTPWSEWVSIPLNGSSEELTYTFEARLDVGWNKVQFNAADLVGNRGDSVEYTIIVKEPEMDERPKAVISSPLNGSSYIEGASIRLDGSLSEDDGRGGFEELRFTWTSNRSGVLGQGEVLDVNILGRIGWHRITLYVDDGTPGHNSSAFVDILIKEVKVDPPVDPDGKENETPLWVYIALLLALVAVIALVLFFVIRSYGKKDEDEVRIDYRQRSYDDLEYDERLDSEERELGLISDDAGPSDPEDERNRLYGDE